MKFHNVHFEYSTNDASHLPGKGIEFVYPRPEVRAAFLLNIADTTKNRQRRARITLGKRTAHYERFILSSSECGDNQIELCFGKNWLDSQRTV
jgi:hypothetical protein